jgi:hypothetical protein
MLLLGCSQLLRLLRIQFRVNLALSSRFMHIRSAVSVHDAIRAREAGTGALPAAAAMEPEPEHAAEMVAAEGTLARSCHIRYAPCRYSASDTGASRPTQTSVHPTLAGAKLLRTLCRATAGPTPGERADRLIPPVYVPFDMGQTFGGLH